jgi:endonuclease/exonuclease/phosphatase family metal-dependent hydrolase
MTSTDSCFVWNVRGLNGRARRNVVREFLVQHRASIVCLQETKLAAVCNAQASEVLGSMYDYAFLPAVNVSGGIILGWHRERWTASQVNVGRFSLTARLTGSRPLEVWWITVVYGPLLDHEKSEFLAELLRLRDGNDEAWLVCGDFNMIYLGGRRRESSCRRSFAADSTLLSSSRAGCFGRRGMQGRSIASHRRRRSWERPSGLRLIFGLLRAISAWLCFSRV